MKLRKILNEILDESKQVGIVYHFTSFHLIVQIINSNKLKAGRATQRIKSDTISTTRDKNFVKNRSGKQFSIYSDPEIGLVLDGTKLSNRYKVMPYDDTVNTGGDVNQKNREEWGDEQEELWYGTALENDGGFKNLNNYLIKVIITKLFIENNNKNKLSFDSIKELGIFPKQFFTKSDPETRLKMILEFFDKKNINYEIEK